MPQTIATAECLLSDVFGCSIRLGQDEDLTSSKRASVYRLQVLNGGGNVPSSVIVKQGRSVPVSALFLNDWASLQFLQQVVPSVPFAPHVYAGDVEQGLFVMEDLGTGQRLDHFLLGDDPVAAETALIEHATLHGQLHALTINKQREYLHLRGALGSQVGEEEYFTFSRLAQTLHEVADQASITPATGVDYELSELAAYLQNPGPFLTFIQGDSCPDNSLYTGTSLRLIDFEGGRFAHALLEGVYGRIHFPSCWCVYRMPEHIPLRMEAAYRAELARGCPAATDDALFYHAVVAACAFWMLESCRWVPLSRFIESDRLLIAASDSQRLLARADILSQATEQFGSLEAIGATMRVVATKMRTLWPETEDMPYYPAFT
jgi:hypothetical protein